MLVVQIVRVAIWWALRAAHGSSAARSMTLLTWASALTGFVWGTAGMLSEITGASPAAIVVPFMLAGMCAGAIAALAAHAPAFFAFIWPALLPYAIRLAAEGDALSRTMALVALLYAVGLVLIGARIFESVQAGMSAATFYLLLPYTFNLVPDSPLGIGRWDHAWPMAFLVWSVLALVYLFIPIAVVVLFSFNDPAGRFNLTWEGFTLDHWKHPFEVEGLGTAFRNSLLIAAIATVIAVALGTLMAMALVRYRFRGRSATDFFVFLPLALGHAGMDIGSLGFVQRQATP